MHNMTTVDSVIVVNRNPDPPSTHNSLNHDPAATKRKRNDGLKSSESRSQQFQHDILQLLERDTTCPSFLKHEFDTNAEEPAQKKARLSNNSGTTSNMASKLSDASYTSLEEIKTDAAKVSRELVSSIREKVNNKDVSSNGRLSVDDLKQIQRIEAFEAHIKEVTETEAKLDAVHKVEDDQSEMDVDTLPNGHGTTDVKHHTIPKKSGTVLTLFGNAPNPKQLFSSMQIAPDTKSESWIKKELNIEEMSLPNGLTATNIMAVPFEDSKHGTSFEDSFAPPHNLSVLQPPRVHKRSSTRDNTISWEFKDYTHRNSRKGGYTVQSLTVGDWLNYGGLDPEYDHTSPKEKRKLRDRALSGGEANLPPPSKASLEENLVRQEDALFRRAFSSFAPSYDNAKAIVPQQTKDMVWWHKLGERRFKETFAIDPALVDDSLSTLTGQNVFEPQNPSHDDDFSNIIENLEEVDKYDPDEPEPAPSKSDIAHVLQEISELLETLASHQRIRNTSLSSIASASRTPISPSSTLASKIGRPDEPGQEEISTYENLRRELSYLVLKLPPYALAKLNGEQLAELAVSKIIPLQMKNIRGTMEEDQVARQAKLAQMATQSSIATLTRPNSSAGQHYNTTAQRTPAIGQAANTRYGSSAQYGARTPAAPQYQRPVPGQQQYGTPSIQRPTYGGPLQYNRPPPLGYGAPNNPQYYQARPTQQTSGGYGGYNPQYYANPQQRPSQGPQPIPQYQQRSYSAASNAVAYQNNSSVHQGPSSQAGSPVKGPGYAAPAPQQRPNYQPQQQPGSGRVTPNQHPSQPNTPVNGYQQPPPPQPTTTPRPASATPQPPTAPPAPVQG